MLDIRSLARAWDGKPALRDLSLTLQAGGMLGLIGPDGAGKTTAMRMSCGLLRPDGGEVRVLGLDVQRDGAAIRPLIDRKTHVLNSSHEIPSRMPSSA